MTNKNKIEKWYLGDWASRHHALPIFIESSRQVAVKEFIRLKLLNKIKNKSGLNDNGWLTNFRAAYGMWDGKNVVDAYKYMLHSSELKDIRKYLYSDD